MDEQKKGPELKERLAEVVRKIEALQEEVAVFSIEDKDISSDWVFDQLAELLVTEEPDGQKGELAYDEEDGSVYVILDARAIGSTRTHADGTITHHALDGTLLKTEPPGTKLTEAVPPWKEA